MNYYIIMLRKEKIDFKSYSPDDFQKILADFDKWNNDMIRENKLLLSGNLNENESKIIRKENIVKDGPYGEIAEAVTGFFIIRAADKEDAVKTASGCPFLQRGGSVEVMPVPDLELENDLIPVAEEQSKKRAETSDIRKEKEDS